jgi:hypothetical protein
VPVRADSAPDGLTARNECRHRRNDGRREGEGPTPLLPLDGYHGFLDGLLTLARSRRIDLAKIPVLDLVDQLVMAVRDTPATTPMGQKGDWVVMASWLVQLRSLLLLPEDAAAGRAAKDEADRFRNRLSGLRRSRLSPPGWTDGRILAATCSSGASHPKALVR